MAGDDNDLEEGEAPSTGDAELDALDADGWRSWWDAYWIARPRWPLERIPDQPRALHRCLTADEAKSAGVVASKPWNPYSHVDNEAEDEEKGPSDEARAEREDAERVATVDGLDPVDVSRVAKRRRGIEMLRAGATTTVIERELDVTHSTVSVWRNQLRAGNLDTPDELRHRRRLERAEEMLRAGAKPLAIVRRCSLSRRTVDEIADRVAGRAPSPRREAAARPARVAPRALGDGPGGEARREAARAAAKEEDAMSQKAGHDKAATKARVLELRRKDPTMTAEALAEKVGVSYSSACRYLAELRADGELPKIGEAKPTPTTRKPRVKKPEPAEESPQPETPASTALVHVPGDALALLRGELARLEVEAAAVRTTIELLERRAS